MPKQDIAGKSVYPGINATITFSSSMEDVKTLHKKLKDLVSTLFGESDTTITEIRTGARRQGKITFSTVTYQVEVWYPQD